MLDREQAWNLLCEFTKSEGLRKHALAVETCVTAYARKLGEDEQKWSLTALLHDFDWEIHPTLEGHPQKGEPILAERGVPEEIRRAILSHANHTGVPRQSPLEKTLYACDELAGFITAISYVKPHRSVHEVDVASVKKKMKDKAFARSVNRQDIVEGGPSRPRFFDWTVYDILVPAGLVLNHTADHCIGNSFRRPRGNPTGDS